MARHADLEPYRDRRHAGVELARQLADVKGQDVVVLALPRGGVPVAFEVARALDAPLDVFVVNPISSGSALMNAATCLRSSSQRASHVSQ